MVSLNKRGVAVHQVVLMVIGLFVLAIVVYVFWTRVLSAQDTFEDCPGECMPVCGGDRPVQYNNRCFKGGERQEGNVCCVGPRDTVIDDPVDPPDVDDLDRPSIEVRMGLLDDPIRHGQSVSLRAGRSYTFYIWGFGEGMSACSIRMIDRTDGSLLPDTHPMHLSISEQPCVDNSLQRGVLEDRDNVIAVEFEPTGRLVGDLYEMQVRLFDGGGVQNQSSNINFRVEMDPEGTQLCQFSSCEDISSQVNCLNPSLVQCPDLDCRWDAEESVCVSRDNPDGFDCPSSCSEVPRDQCDDIHERCPGLLCELSPDMRVGCIERMT